MRACHVEFVITEHPPAITEMRDREYSRIREMIERVARTPVVSRNYCDVGEFDDAVAVVLSGSFAPWASHDSAALARLGEALGRFDGPVLGICAGMQLQTIFAGGAIAPRTIAEVGFGPVEIVENDGLLAGLGEVMVVYQHHAEDVVVVPDEFVVVARSKRCAVEAIAAPQRRWWGTQFHPERFSAKHPAGARVLRNFFALAGLGEGTVTPAVG